ncbi:uncharacterized protein LOC117343722 [Pecten maximus]|uniref:uncharacterized protein LOC117343722 n=1 Tax=Pecten maximus TaxID=6579 RepID=UPI001458FB1D|nr:uncharacterized protein LOC117343722 [Pecten maximus]
MSVSLIILYLCSQNWTCYRDTTRKLCDWYYDRPSTSSQADQYAATSPRLAVSSDGNYQGENQTVAPNTMYSYSDQFWNDHYRQLKTDPGQSSTTFTYYKSSNPVSRPISLPGKQTWCCGMSTPFQVAMAKLYPGYCTAVEVGDVKLPSDEGSSVDPCHIPQHESNDVIGSSVDPHWTLGDNISDVD